MAVDQWALDHPEEKKASVQAAVKKHRAKKKFEAEERDFMDKFLNGEIPNKGEFLTPQQLLCVYTGAEWREEGDVTDSKYKKEKKKRVVVEGSKILGQDVTFQKWLALRREHRADMWTLVHTMRPGVWNEGAHRPLINFFVRKDNSDLPVEYTQDEKNTWLRKQDTQHDRLLLYPRGFRKSTISMIDAVQWILNCPDLIILVVTSTRALGKKFLGLLREYFEIRNYGHPTDFQKLFPEFCIPIGDGDAKEFVCPLRHLTQADPTVSYSSMESASAGARSDIIKFDDAVDEQNYIEVDMRLKVLHKMDAFGELLIRPYGYIEAIGTRYTDGLPGDVVDEDGVVKNCPDMYGAMLRRNEESEDKDMKILIGRAWTVLEHARSKKIKDLLPEDVTLLWNDPDPHSPGSFKVLMKKCKNNELFFRCQQLNEPVAKLETEEVYINTFTEENIRDRIKNPSWVGGVRGVTYIFGDTALTEGKKSDYSAFVTARIEERPGEYPLVWFLEVVAGHWSDKEQAQKLADLINKWRPEGGVYIEDIPSLSTTEIKMHIRREIVLRGCENIAFAWFPADKKPGAKENRIRSLQLLHERGLVRFIDGPWTDLMMNQLVRYNGDKKKHKGSFGGRKDDIPDAMSFVLRVLPYIPGTMTEEELEKRKQETEAIALKKMADDSYRRMFGLAPGTIVSSLGAQQEPEPRNPIHDALSALNRPTGRRE